VFCKVASSTACAWGFRSVVLEIPEETCCLLQNVLY